MSMASERYHTYSFVRDSRTRVSVRVHRLPHLQYSIDRCCSKSAPMNLQHGQDVTAHVTPKYARPSASICDLSLGYFIGHEQNKTIDITNTHTHTHRSYLHSGHCRCEVRGCAVEVSRVDQITLVEKHDVRTRKMGGMNRRRSFLHTG